MSQYLWELTFIALSIIANALYVAAEFSLARSRPSKIESLLPTGGFLIKIVHRAVNRLNDYISAAQVGITISSLVLGAFAESFFAKILNPFLIMVHVPEYWLHIVSFILAMMIATYLHVVIGEFIPKTLALQYPELVAKLTIMPLHWTYKLSKPLVWVLNSSANLMLKIVGIPASNKSILAFSEEEFKLLLKESQREGVIEAEEEEMVNKVFAFNDTVVREVMTPRTEIIGVSENVTVAEAAEIAVKNRISKIPVYENNMDNVIGLISSPELTKLLLHEKRHVSIREITHSIMKVPESKSLSDLLEDFQKNRVQIAIVLDEFGGTAGLVTLEDIVEELVGDIQDEDDGDEENFQQISDNECIIQARVSIEEVNERLKANFSDEHYDTIGGFIFGLIGREPLIGDEVEFAKWILKVDKLDDRKIQSVRITLVDIPAEEETSDQQKTELENNSNGNSNQSNSNGSNQANGKENNGIGH